MITLSTRLSPDNEIEEVKIKLTLSLTAEERRRSRYKFVTPEGLNINLQLPRGTILYNQDLLRSEQDGCLVRIVAQPEPVYVINANTSLELLRAAYHLGNRHVPVEITETDLRLAPDPVLKRLLEQLGLQVEEAYQPFQPEGGAYHHNHAESHTT